jgi:hypothetical protein
MQVPPWKVRCPICREFFQPRHAGQVRCSDPICRRNGAFVDEFDKSEREMTRIAILLEDDV